MPTNIVTDMASEMALTLFKLTLFVALICLLDIVLLSTLLASVISVAALSTAADDRNRSTRQRVVIHSTSTSENTSYESAGTSNGPQNRTLVSVGRERSLHRQHTADLNHLSKHSPTAGPCHKPSESVASDVLNTPRPRASATGDFQVERELESEFDEEAGLEHQNTVVTAHLSPKIGVNYDSSQDDDDVSDAGSPSPGTDGGPHDTIRGEQEDKQWDAQTSRLANLALGEFYSIVTRNPDVDHPTESQRDDGNVNIASGSEARPSEGHGISFIVVDRKRRRVLTRAGGREHSPYLTSEDLELIRKGGGVDALMNLNQIDDTY
ncbi:hypothetical protein PQX77_002009 [Marasmius sp. AFHP31]|nr:hypothetical protein PQX77_002009 [Marasmius sp. AFHP31]